MNLLNKETKRQLPLMIFKGKVLKGSGLLRNRYSMMEKASCLYLIKCPLFWHNFNCLDPNCNFGEADENNKSLLSIKCFASGLQMTL